MKKMKRILAAGLALVLVLGLCACGGESPEEVMQKVMENSSALTSLRYEMEMETSMSVMDQSIEMNTFGTAACINAPIQMEMELTMDMGEMGSGTTTVYMVEEDGLATTYTGADMGDGNMIWQKQVMDIAQLEQYDAQASFDLYMNSAESFQEKGVETINDVKATRYDGVIKGEAMSEVLGSSGMLSQMSSLGIPLEQAEAMFTEMGDLTVSIWVDKANYLPVKYEIDMTDMMQKMMSAILGEAQESVGITVDLMFMSMTILEVNSVEEIVIPEEALNAEELDMSSRPDGGLATA